MNDEALAKTCKALGHPVRVRILRTLIEKGCCVSDLVDALPLAQSTVSQHLKVLSEAGLVAGRVDGPKRCYCANPAALRALGEALSTLNSGDDPCASTSTCPPRT